jgi:hypothetical protein
MPAANHTAPQREFIVRRLAAFRSPRAIVAEFARAYPGVYIHETEVEALDPMRFAVLPPDLAELYRTTRESILADPESDPFTKRKARLIVLSEMVADAMARGAPPSDIRSIFNQIEQMELNAKVAGGDAPPGGGAEGAPAKVITWQIVDPEPVA